MRRRPLQPGTPLNQKQEELARRESQLRGEREELLVRATEGGSRLDVSIALQDKRWGDAGRGTGRRKSLRKERREGRIIFLVLVIALGLAVIWLATHLQF
jgi:hypothetical protein